MKTHILAQVQMKPVAQGGRHCEFFADWCPHLVIPPSSILHGVRVIDSESSDGSILVFPGQDALVVFQLSHLGADYSAVVQGAKFEIIEGGRVVGTGEVLEYL